MTTIIGIINENGVWMGADGANATDEGERRPILIKKIIRNREYLFAFSGSVRTGQLLYPEYFTPPRDIFDLPDRLREYFGEKGCIAVSPDNQTEIHLSNILVGYKEKLYEILIDFQMNEVPEFDALGSGSSYAFGALYITRKAKLTPEQRIKMALQAACEFDLATTPPFSIEKL